MKRPLTGLLTVVAVSIGLTFAAYARSFTVVSTADSPDPFPGDGICGDPALPDSLRCTLRSAVDEANAHAGADTILFRSGLASIRLSLGALMIDDNATIVDGGSSSPVLDGLNDPFFSSLLVLRSDSNLIMGLKFQRARFHAIVVEGADNCIGDSSGRAGTSFIQNGLDRTSSAAIYIAGIQAQRNHVVACRIGLTSGDSPSPNQNGIVIDSLASGNLIGAEGLSARNYICGNSGYGVIISGGATLNRIINCWIGPDRSGTMGSGNSLGGVLISRSAQNNFVGGRSPMDLNLISWNNGPAVTITGYGTRGNTIKGNWVGLDISGSLGISNASGILISDGASNNLIGGTDPGSRNVISGNSGDGIRLEGSGTGDNSILGNFIGTDSSGYAGIGNGQTSGDGISIGPGSTRTIVGGNQNGAGNVISGNPRAGVRISGSTYNILAGNMIGVSIQSVSSCPNGVGVRLEAGASNNTIGGVTAQDANIISGNRYDLFPNGAGVQIIDPGTDNNIVIGNKIGTDISGTRSLRNGSCGVTIGNGAKHNRIGGSDPGERNVISGNGAGSIQFNLGAGVHIFGDGTSFNRISGNYIGVSSNGADVILNYGNGIAIVDGASDNLIGGEIAADGNLIARNAVHGILESGAGTTRNTLQSNLISQNDSLGIAVRVPGTGVPPPPVLTSATANEVTGNRAPSKGKVQIYLAAVDPSGSGEGAQVVGEGTADSAGSFAIPVNGLQSGDFVTAVATDTSGSSSAFAVNLMVDAPTVVNQNDSSLPTSFGLEQNFPNPFNPSTRIRFSVARAARVRLEIFNELGQTVTTLFDQQAARGTYAISWNGKDQVGREVASGIYFCRLTADQFTATRKLALIK